MKNFSLHESEIETNCFVIFCVSKTLSHSSSVYPPITWSLFAKAFVYSRSATVLLQLAINFALVNCVSSYRSTNCYNHLLQTTWIVKNQLLPVVRHLLDRFPALAEVVGSIEAFIDQLEQIDRGLCDQMVLVVLEGLALLLLFHDTWNDRFQIFERAIYENTQQNSNTLLQAIIIKKILKLLRVYVQPLCKLQHWRRLNWGESLRLLFDRCCPSNW